MQRGGGGATQVLKGVGWVCQPHSRRRAIRQFSREDGRLFPFRKNYSRCHAGVPAERSWNSRKREFESSAEQRQRQRERFYSRADRQPGFQGRNRVEELSEQTLSSVTQPGHDRLGHLFRGPGAAKVPPYSLT